MTDKVNVKIELCRKKAVLPEYANETDAGMDIYAAEDTIVKPKETVKVPIGIKLAIPAGYEMQIRPRSGISAKTPLRIPNSPGTIDSGYRDEVMVLIYNSSIDKKEDHQSEPYTLEDKGNKNGSYIIKAGERIAQLVLVKVPSVKWERTYDVKKFGEDRGGGFGSSGV